MSRWGQNMDDLAAAVADLLTDTSVRTTPLTDTAATLACRDAVVGELRQLVGGLADMPPVAEARPLQMFDVTNRPAQALQLALAELPRASQFGGASVDTYFQKGLPPYEQRWRDAARAAVGLEIFVETLGRVPDHHSWAVLRDLADLSAAIPALDHGLSEALLPWLKGGEDLAVPYAMLTHPGHDAVRVCTTEIRARVPADPPSSSTAPLIPAVLGAGELDAAMGRYVQIVLDRGLELSIGDMRAVTRLLEFSGTHAALVLERAQQAVPGAGVAAAGLRELAPLAQQLRDSPAKSLGPERLDLLRGSSELQARMGALAVQERKLPGGVGEDALRRLAAPALEFARHVPNLGRALEVAVRESLTQGLTLIPSRTDRLNRTELLWVTASMQHRAWDEGPPAVQAHAELLARAAESIGPSVRHAQTELLRHQVQVVDPARQAAAAARSHAGAARAQLREVLGQQAASWPPPLSSPLPAHPRLAPDGPISGRGR